MLQPSLTEQPSLTNHQRTHRPLRRTSAARSAELAGEALARAGEKDAWHSLQSVASKPAMLRQRVFGERPPVRVARAISHVTDAASYSAPVCSHPSGALPNRQKLSVASKDAARPFAPSRPELPCAIGSKTPSLSRSPFCCSQYCWAATIRYELMPRASETSRKGQGPRMSVFASALPRRLQQPKPARRVQPLP